MDFLSLKNSLAAGVIILVWTASPWLASTHAVQEKAKEKPAVELLRAAADWMMHQDPAPQEDSKQEEQPSDDTKPDETEPDKPEPAPKPAPPTDEEKQLVERLLEEVDAPVYETRRSAQLQLIELGKRLPIILAELAPPASIEAKSAIEKALRRLDEKSFLLYNWHLTSWPRKGETLDLEPSSIVFKKDKSFIQAGHETGAPETWRFNKATQELVMDFNSGYAIYTGKEDKDGNFVGTAKNIKKKQWHFKLKRLGKRR